MLPQERLHRPQGRPLTLCSCPHPAAWRTGLTLENVLLRLDAFEHLQLPVELLHGSIGRIQAQARTCCCLPHGCSAVVASSIAQAAGY